MRAASTGEAIKLSTEKSLNRMYPGCQFGTPVHPLMLDGASAVWPVLLAIIKCLR